MLVSCTRSYCIATGMMTSADKGNPRTGWAPVLAIHDLAMILEALRDELHTLLNDLD